MDIKKSIYRFINKENEIIYIGQAKDLKNRLNNHNHLPKECYDDIEKIEYVEFETMDDMAFAERYFISKVKPKYNTVFKNKNISLNLSDLDTKIWKVLNKDKLKEDENLYSENEIISLIKISSKMNELLLLDEIVIIYRDLSHDVCLKKYHPYFELYLNKIRDIEKQLKEYMINSDVYKKIKKKYKNKVIDLSIKKRKINVNDDIGFEVIDLTNYYNYMKGGN